MTFEQKPEGSERADRVNPGGMYRAQKVQEACAQAVAGAPCVPWWSEPEESWGGGRRRQAAHVDRGED